MGDIWKGGAKVDYKASLESIPLYGKMNMSSDIVFRIRVTQYGQVKYRLTMTSAYQRPGDTRWFGSHRHFQKPLPPVPLNSNVWYLAGDSMNPQYQYYNPGILPIHTSTVRTPEVEIGSKMSYVFTLEYLSGSTWRKDDECELHYFLDTITIKSDKSAINSGDEVMFYGHAPVNSKITIKDVNNSLGGAPTTIGTTYSDANGKWSLTTKVSRAGVTGDYNLNIVAATGTLQSKPVQIDVSFISDLAQNIGKGLGLDNVDWDKMKLYGGAALAVTGVVGGLLLYTKVRGSKQNIRIKIDR